MKKIRKAIAVCNVDGGFPCLECIGRDLAKVYEERNKLQIELSELKEKK